MFKLPKPPSPKAEVHELADFIELLCWDRGVASTRDVVACLGREGDNDHNVGCDDDDDENSAEMDEVMNEIERRATACGGGFPFDLDPTGSVLRYKHADTGHRSILYRYLLLSTRLNMRDNSVYEKLNGTALFEELSAHVLKKYIGGDRAQSLVFGTSESGNFEEKVNSLCKELREGNGFFNRDVASVHAKDDKLDTVAWVPFSDKLPGQLVLFAQCKTGTTWSEQTTQLQPDAFIGNWMKDPFLVVPVRTFCVAEAVNRTHWKKTCRSAGVLIDRCRIVDFSDGINDTLLGRIQRWTNAAKATINYSGK